MGLKVGDKVKLKSEHHNSYEVRYKYNYMGTGIIERVDGDDFKVRWEEDNDYWWYRGEQLEKVENTGLKYVTDSEPLTEEQEGVLGSGGTVEHGSFTYAKFNDKPNYEHLSSEELQSKYLNNNKPKILVLGKARHGKDTFCEILRDNYGYKFESSSARIIKEFLPFLQKLYGFKDFEEAYESRFDMRDFLFQLVSAYNSKDLTRMAQLVLEGNDIYCGMRSYEEVEACKESGVFDLIVWVDAEERLGDTEPSSSCTVVKSQADIVIENDDSKVEFEDKVKNLMELIGGSCNED